LSGIYRRYLPVFELANARQVTRGIIPINFVSILYQFSLEQKNAIDDQGAVRGNRDD
jgi:hypothetical protein